MHPLLALDDEQFEDTIQTMDIQSVLESVAGLQEQMIGEQEQFDELSGSLAKLTPSDPEFSDLRGELATLQDRLALLLDRNMRCLQVANEGAARAEQHLADTQFEPADNGNSVLDFETLEKNLVSDQRVIVEDIDEPNEGEPEDLIPAWRRNKPKPTPSQKPKLKAVSDSPKKVRFSFDEDDADEKKDNQKDVPVGEVHVNGTSSPGLNGQQSEQEKKETDKLSVFHSGSGESFSDNLNIVDRPTVQQDKFQSSVSSPVSDTEKVLPWKKKFSWSPLRNKSLSLENTVFSQSNQPKDSSSDVQHSVEVSRAVPSQKDIPVNSSNVTMNAVQNKPQPSQATFVLRSSQKSVNDSGNSQMDNNNIGDKPYKFSKPSSTSSSSASTEQKIAAPIVVQQKIAAPVVVQQKTSAPVVVKTEAMNKENTDEHDRINFSAARSMFEGGVSNGTPAKTTKTNQTNRNFQKRPPTTNGGAPNTNTNGANNTNGFTPNGFTNNVQKTSFTVKLNTTGTNGSMKQPPPPAYASVKLKSANQSVVAQPKTSVPPKSEPPKTASVTPPAKPDKPVVTFNVRSNHLQTHSVLHTSDKLEPSKPRPQQPPPQPPAKSQGESETINGAGDSLSGSSAGERTPSPADVVCSGSSSPHQESRLSSGPAGDVAEVDEINGDEKVKERVTLQGWDPDKLLRDLYKMDLQPNVETSCQYINMEGYMEKLPANKKKATLLKTWKRRFFRAQDGSLHYYECRDDAWKAGPPPSPDTFIGENGGDHASGSLQLMGGHIEELGGQMLGVDDGRGHYLVLRCPSEEEYQTWTRALQSQTVDNMPSKYMKAQLSAPPHPSKKIIIFDLGSCSVRAGILRDKPTLPQLFFPTIVATDNGDGSCVCGFDACKPDIRHNSTITYPVRPSIKVDKFSLDLDMMPHLIQKVFDDLEVDPTKYWVMFSSPANFSDKFKADFVDLFLTKFGVVGVNIVNQTLLALYAYNTSSGIVVDVGERLEILPVTDGYIADGGVSRQPYGGRRVTEAMNSSLTEQRYHFFTDVEFCIARLAMERLCYVAQDYNEEVKRLEKDRCSYQKTLPLIPYDLPKGSWTEITADSPRFKSPEGIFNLDSWGMDNPSLQKLVQKAVTACPMDTRREMWRSVYLSGGLTMMPGFADRLQKELQKIAPPSIVVQVHASPQRYHASYVGACVLAGMGAFERSCITAPEWKKEGVGALRKWQMY